MFIDQMIPHHAGAIGMADAQFANLAGSADIGSTMAVYAGAGIVNRAQSRGDVFFFHEYVFVCLKRSVAGKAVAD